MKKVFFVVASLALMAVLALNFVKSPNQNKPARSNQFLETASTNLTKIAASVSQTNPPTPTNQVSLKLKSRLTDFSDTERDEFKASFTNRYKPAFQKWAAAFAGHVPFAAESLTLETFVERIGRTTAYHEYIFVVDGITLGIQDAKGVARVDYLNAPKQTGKMTRLPDGTDAPVTSTPVQKSDLISMLAIESGNTFSANDVRVTPSGLSGSLNGGIIANVGGDPDNAASWKYDIVFDADGKLAYYLKGR